MIMLCVMEETSTRLNDTTLLLDTLKTIWQNFLESKGTNEAKLHWIQLYLFYSKFVDEDALKSEGLNSFCCSFIHQVPEEVCSFFLETVFEIISKSGLNINQWLDENGESSSKSTETKYFRPNNNFSQVVLSKPSDCNKIISLRNFLTNQLGQHLLVFLLNTDNKLIASLKSLCNLCINLYPNCPWDNGSTEIRAALPILQIIGGLKYNRAFTLKKSLSAKLTCTRTQGNDDTTHCPPTNQPSHDNKDIIQALQENINSVITSDELAFLLIQMLLKCVSNEYETKLNEQSMSIISLKFALESLCGEDSTYSSPRNATTIKFTLLLLITQCLNNIFVDASNMDYVQFEEFFAKLALALENNSIDQQQNDPIMDKIPLTKESTFHKKIMLLCAINYIFFNALQNLVKVYLHKINKNRHSQNDLYALKFLKGNAIDMNIVKFTEILTYSKNTEYIEKHNDLHILIENTFKTLVKIIDQLCKYDHVIYSNRRMSYGCEQKKLHNRFFYLPQMHCRMKVQSMSCFFQGVLIKLLLRVSFDLQEYALRYLIRAGACCCHCTLDTYNIFLKSVLNISPQYQKYAYKFLYQNVLNIIFLRDKDQNCPNCDAKFKSVDFHEGIMLCYKDFYKNFEIGDINMSNDNKSALLLLLKHFKHISPALINILTGNILADIVWPTFRQFRANLIECKKMFFNDSKNTFCHVEMEKLFLLKNIRKNCTFIPLSRSPKEHIKYQRKNLYENQSYQLIIYCLKVLHECLNIFAVYLSSDIRLIKAFYNEENVNHLEDLLAEPLLTKHICDLIKIGIVNLSFLGDNSQEQMALSQRLIALQLKSSDHIAILANDLFSRLTSKFSKAINKGHVEHVCDLGNISPCNLLYVAALQWSLNHELLKTSQSFYNKFAKMYSMKEEDTSNEEGKNIYDQNQVKNLNENSLLESGKTISDILKLNYNALCSFLILSFKKPQIQITATEIGQPHKDELTLTNRINCTTDKVNDCLSNELESFLSSVELATAPQSFNSISSSISLVTNTTASGKVSYAWDDNSYERVTECYSTVKDESFLQNLHEKREKITDLSLTESIVLFDIRNQSYENEYSYLFSTISGPRVTSLNCANNIPPPSSVTESRVLQGNLGILGKLYSIFEGFFTGSRSNFMIDLNCKESEYNIDRELQCLYELNGDCKKYLIKLFEATMAICIKGFQNEEAEKMEKHLKKLKVVILSNAASNWQQYSEDQSRENPIIKTLQTLLKLANLSNSINDPANIFDSNALSPVTSVENLDSTSRVRVGSFNKTKNSQSDITTRKTLTILNQKPRRALSGGYCETDCHSNPASSVVYDSEIEFSENNEDVYMTTDEGGYDADEEILEFSDSEAEMETADFWNTFRPTSRYRTHVLHDGLCQLVVEILIKLCERCTQNPKGWSDKLAQLVNRLFVIREHIGDSLFLLRGFAPVLQCNDPYLRDLQQSILELVVDLNTPDILCAYFNILAAKNPPVDILIKYINYISNNSIKKPEPCAELSFPITIDGMCNSTCDPHVTEQINRIRNCHLHSQVITPFTRSPCIIPISHSKLWNSDGFTLSMWVQVKSLQNDKSSNQLLEDNIRCSIDEYTKTHITSIGTNQMTLSIYINSNMNFVLEFFQPNMDIHSQIPMDYNYMSNINTNNSERNLPDADITSNVSTFRVALKHTKSVILNSFNNMPIFHKHDDNQPYQYSSIELKSLRITKNKWTHYSFSIGINQDSLDITIYMNGIEHQKTTMQIRNLRNISRTHVFQTILLGDSVPVKLPNNSNCTESHTPSDGCPIHFSISNLLLFNRKFTNSDSILSLAAMGPDFKELDQFEVGNLKPNFGFLGVNKSPSLSFGNFAESIKELCNSRILKFSAETPEIVMIYDMTELDMAYGRNHGLILYGELIQNQLKSLQTATLLSGGLSTLLYLFARVVEISNNSVSQFMALELLLKTALSDTQLYTEFSRSNYMSLIGYVIKTDRCTKDVNLLKSIVNNACSQPLIYNKGDMVQITENTMASVTYPKLIISVLHRYSDWHRSGAEHSDVLDTLFLCILALTREKHPHRNFNVEQLNRAGLLKELLNLCKVYVIESPNPVYISKNAADSFIAILSVFIGSPPQPSCLDEIMKLILLLHKPSECYITHDRSKFYFLLTAQPLTKEKITTEKNVNRATTSLRKSFKREYVDTTSHTAESSSELDKRKRKPTRIRQKLNLLSSPYSRALYELNENLDNVAHCIKLNKTVLRSLPPNEVINWRTKLKQYILNTPQRNRSKVKNSKKNINDLSPTKKIFHKRIRLSTASNHSHRKKGTNQSKQNSDKNVYSSNISLPLLNREKRGSTSLNDTLSATHSQRVNKPLIKTDFYSSIGIITLQEGLFTLLKNQLCLLPDSSVEEVLKHYIKIELLLVLSNNSSCAVRTAIIKLLVVLSKRLSSTDLLTSKKNLYPQHLANQMSIYPSDITMFESCLEWVSGVYGALNSTNNPNIHVKEEFGLNTLLAILTNVNDHHNYLEKAFRILRNIFISEEEKQGLIDAGLLQCSVKALYNLYTNFNDENLKSENSILELLTTIGETSLKSVGHMNFIWDILAMLSFYYKGQPASIVKNFRSLQCQLLINWITMILGDTNGPTNFKTITIPGSTLSLYETKTRLDLLIDYCTQIFTTFDAKYTPSISEIKLFQLLVTYSLATSQRCNNFIAWGLQPSRPRELRSFIINSIWISCQNDCLPPIICDGKMIKSLLWLCLLENLKDPLDNLESLCQLLGIKETDSTWNLENELERMELDQLTILAKQKSLSEKIIYRLEPFALNCIDSSMLTTRRVTELQNAERKAVMNQLKDYDDTFIYTKWMEIVHRMTHEGAPWYYKDRTENSWELDDTEGPSRVHVRLRRCHLDLDKRFLMQDYNPTKDAEFNSLSDSTNCIEYSRPLQYLFTNYDQQLNISLNSQIIYNFPAKYLPVDGEIDGEIIVTEDKLYFMATYHCRYFYIHCDIISITEIWLKRYQHQEKAFEIYLDTNKSLFFSLQNQEDWKILCDIFCDKIITPPDQTKVLIITQQWREGLLTNWEYLMTLNQFAGRTYNDLMQYPVFPWILSDYKSDSLDLTNESNFRKLEKPIAVQYQENEQHYINNYKYISNTMTSMGTIILKPYHYSSHYSNSGTVLHFLVRVPPFTSYFLRYQDNNFDLPDRTFHSLNTTWNLASRDSPTDVKELIPEFFCLPEMFENFEHFNFGFRQNGERVEDVKLPPWSLRDARLFVLIHRQALEAEITRNNLHNWIDLIFGHKQTGENAVEAINVFHPATYAAFQESIIPDPIERKAVETMIKTYGQMPRQLFKQAHPQSKSLDYCLSNKVILPSVRGLRWGVYVGSPQLPTPTLGNIYKLPSAEYLISLNNSNIIYGLPSKSCIMQGTEFDIYHAISWGYDDRIVRISPLNKIHSKAKNLLSNDVFDEITTCGTDPNLNQLWFGHKSGRISIYKCASEVNSRFPKVRQNFVKGIKFSYNSAFRKITTKSTLNLEEGENENTASVSSSRLVNSGLESSRSSNANLVWSGPTVLLRHTDEVTNIRLSVEFKIAVSAGRDGMAVVWDLNNWSYIHTINRPSEIHHSPISLVTISPTLGDIVTVHTIPPQQQQSQNVSINDEETACAAADECFEVTEENLDGFVNVLINPNGKSLMRLHTVNGRYVHHITHEDRISAVCYSYIKEGVGVNVIATAIEGGIIRLWSSWNLSFVSEIVTGISNIKSIMYSTHQHLVVLTKDFHIQVWETEGLYGSSPKFPQLAYK